MKSFTYICNRKQVRCLLQRSNDKKNDYERTKLLFDTDMAHK